MRSFWRGIRVLAGLMPLVVGFLRDRKRWIVVGSPARRSERHHQRRAEKLVARVAKLGPTFIKLGQLMSARADIFPEPYLTVISALQDQAPPDPTDQIIAVIERELGRPVDEVFDEFDREPAAAASLGQVHRAVVDGGSVAVKVLRPGVEELVALDLDISFRLLFWLNVLFPNHHIQALSNVVREFSHRVREEMDFRRESENIERFQRCFRDDASVRAPEVLDEYTRRRVLVMEHCTGTKVDQLHDKFTEGSIRFNDVMERLTGLCSCSCSCSCSSSRLICSKARYVTLVVSGLVSGTDKKNGSHAAAPGGAGIASRAFSRREEDGPRPCDFRDRG